MEQGKNAVEGVNGFGFLMNEYQAHALETRVYPDEHAVVYPILGLCGESGELANKIKKVLRGDKELTDEVKSDLANELGDCLWYVAVIAHDLGYTLDEIATLNVTKLQERQRNNSLRGDGDNR